MINRKIFAGIILLLILVAAGLAISKRNQTFKVNVFESSNGWGYDILRKNKIIIHQPFMPAVQGEIAFRNKSAARKTGRLVVKKLENKQLPTINKEELNTIIRDTD